METLQNRQQELIKILYEASSPVSRDYLSRELEVSTRTVLNEIKNINDILKNKGISIITERGRGYTLVIESDEVKTSLSNLLQNNVKSSSITESAIRVKDIIRIMIEKNSYITVQEIADLLYVSKQTISNDIKEVKVLLSQFDLQMKSRAGYGLYLEGDERGKRKCYCFCLPFNLNDENIFEISSKEITFFKNIEIDKIFSIVTESLLSSDWEIIDGAEKILTMHIAMSIMRIKQGVKLNSISVNLIEYEKENQFVKLLLKNIGTLMDVTFSDMEQQYILTYFISCSKDNLITNITEKRVQKLLDFIWENYNFDFRKDKDLRRDLLIHMSAYEKRAKFKIWAKNPILEDIKEKYILFFEMAIASLKNVYHENYEIDDGEAGFIALHLVSSNTNIKNEMKKIRIIIVCAAGRVSGKLIEKMILNEFGDQVLIESVISYADYKKTPVLDCDIVLSNIALDKKNTNVYRIKGIPEREELYAILQEYRLNNQQRTNSLCSLLKQDIYFPKLNFNTKEEVLHYLCQTMKDIGYVSDQFEYQIFEREKVSSTVMGKGIAMPHPLTNESIKTGIAIAVLEKDIIWDDKKVNMIFMMNVKEDMVKNLTFFYDQIIKLMKEYQMRDQLLETTDFEEFFRIFCS